jgi:hypothetical protein
MPAQHAFQRRLESIEELLDTIGSAADPSLRTTANQLIQLVMELHGTGLERMLEIIDAAGQPGAKLIDKLSEDELVSSLLVLHGLHPLDLETRVRRALETVHGGNAELLSAKEGAVHLRLHPTGNGSGKSFRAVVEAAVYNAAPDITSLMMEGGGEQDGFVPIETLLGHSLATAEKGRL